ncbi:MAG: hypothetical protein AB3N64_13775 [Puniceicoccaceae bacterium]
MKAGRCRNWVVVALQMAGVLAGASTVDCEIGSRLELFTDDYLVGRMDGLRLKLHAPQLAPAPEQPLIGAYTTVLKDGDRFRAWYRAVIPGYDGERYDGHPGELTCYAESMDGHDWTFPELDIHEVRGPQGGNVILAGQAPFSHNFSPFIDTRPDCPPNERYKAMSGVHAGGGLHAFVSADGIDWREAGNGPVITSEAFAFDSQSSAFWSEAEGRYICYFRSWTLPEDGLRTISRTTSEDFLNWTPPVPMHPNLPGEHLYTNNTHPYFRAPHLYIALPTRFLPDRGNSTDILFMTTRVGSDHYDRTFTEAFIRPGLDPARWGNRANYAALNVLPTGPDELSIWHGPSGRRYTLRTDGFVSVHAGAEAGELLTKVLTFSGNQLVINASTSAAGSIRVEMQAVDGSPLDGFSLDDSEPFVGDAIEHVINWKGQDNLHQLIGKPVRIRFVLQEADLFSIRFRPVGDNSKKDSKLP